MVILPLSILARSHEGLIAISSSACVPLRIAAVAGVGVQSESDVCIVFVCRRRDIDFDLVALHVTRNDSISTEWKYLFAIRVEQGPSKSRLVGIRLKQLQGLRNGNLLQFTRFTFHLLMQVDRVFSWYRRGGHRRGRYRRFGRGRWLIRRWLGRYGTCHQCGWGRRWRL
jgi:hypothetical protein